MKTSYVADLLPETSITSFFLVCEKELRTTREGRAFLRLELGDRSGTIEARVWENAEQLSGTFDRDDVVKVQGRVESYRNKVQLSVERIRRAQAEEVDLADYLPHTAEDVEQLLVRLRAHAAAIRNPWLNQLVGSVIGDPVIVPKLKRAPAAKMMHHAYVGGLLEHVVSLCDLCRIVAEHYREVDTDLLITGAILHDIGKLDELCYERAIHYTTEGQLLGHIVLEVEMVAEKMRALEGFPEELQAVVKHLLVSHHGHYEFGSPKLPMFREALLLHYLDDLDSKMAAVRAAICSEGGDGEWTAYSGALNRRLLRVERYLQPGISAPAGPSQGRLKLGGGAGESEER